MTDMPAGKEKTDQLSMPIGLSTENDGKYFLLCACFFDFVMVWFDLLLTSLPTILFSPFLIINFLQLIHDITAILTHLAASNFNEIWAIVSESGIPAPPPEIIATPITPVAAAPAGNNCVNLSNDFHLLAIA